jgi:primosomal protein N' (replication factor Y) (superfamily II helicase)
VPSDASAGAPDGTGSPPPLVVRVLPDPPAIAKTFDYTVPAGMAGEVRVGSVVRVNLHGRRVGAWVVAVGVEPPAGVTLAPIAKVTGWGPGPELIELADWGAWRWAGRPAQLLRTASPDTAVRVLPPARPRRSAPTGPEDPLAAEALAAVRAVVRLPPDADTYGIVLAAAGLGNALVLVPSASGARHLALRLGRAGIATALVPRDWAQARAGATVIGTRAGAFAPVADLAAVVVLDEHDERWQQERAPTWHARDVAVERARRAGVPCVLASPTPSLEALAWGRLVVPSRSVEREGWPRVDVVDRRQEDIGRAGLFSPRLVHALRGGGRVVCVLNRKGRAGLLACVRCGETARCERCDAAVSVDPDDQLVCRRCGTSRPQVCSSCGGTGFKNLRPGVARVREELEALARRPVVEISAGSESAGADGGRPSPVPTAEVFVGTEAALHRLASADVVAFLDFDQELLAPRYRAAEEALALLVLASRLLGGRQGSGRLLIQTRLPHHEVVQAALLGDPARVAAAELARRQLLGYPPLGALATVSGAGAPEFMARLGSPPGVQALGPSDGQWLLRADEHAPLLDALAATPRPPGRLRIAVDPLRP